MSAPIVVKAFGQNHTGNGGLLAVRKVDPSLLSPVYPWFVQKNIVDASHDVTVVCVGEQLFAYELARDHFVGEDCRFPSFLQDLPWNPIALTEDQTTAIRSFMKATGFTYGRIDFLRDPEGLWFLEVNPNGQFAWLDPESKNGLIDAVAQSIREVHQRHKAACQVLA
jgi:hypothetical protein